MMKSPLLPGKLMKRAFFAAPVERVAPWLLGKVLVHRTREGVLAGRIVEVEAYLGPHHEIADRAAHSHRGPTPRNQVLFGPAGHAYVYAIYGRYYCMNISCESVGHAGSILVRALEPVAGLEQMARNRGLDEFPPILSAAANKMDGAQTRKGWGALEAAGANGFDGATSRMKFEKWARELTGGPGRLCQAMSLTRAQNGLDLLDPRSPLQVLDDGMRVMRVLVTRRIGIRHAVELPLRFAVPGHPCVSGARNMAGTCIFLRAGTVLRKKRSLVKSSERKPLSI